MGRVDEAVAGLSAALDSLAGLELIGMPADELLTLTDALETARRRLPAIGHGVISELDRQHVAFELGAHDTAALLAQRLNLSRSAAKRRVLDARDLGPEPAFPILATAQALGQVSEEHAGLIIRAVDSLPGDQQTHEIEADLLAHATRETPDQLRHRVRELKNRLDPDDAKQNAADHHRRRELTLRSHADGSAELSGHLTPEAGIKWQTILSAISAPRPAEDGTPDERTAAQRRHDGLLDLADRVLDSGGLPDSGGTPVTLVITATADQVQQRRGLATTDHGATIDMHLALQLADACDTYLTFTDITGQLHLGRTKRLAQPAQRRALAIRDGGCSFPGCETPPSWCQAHHVLDWIKDGDTDIDNLTLVCGHHHREHQRLGWSVQIINNQVRWKPPPKQPSSRVAA